MGSNILPSSRRTVFAEYLLCVRHLLSIYLIPLILFNPFEDPSRYTQAFDFLVALPGMRDLSSPTRD